MHVFRSHVATRMCGTIAGEVARKIANHNAVLEAVGEA